MPDIKEQLRTDLTTAMRDRDEVTVAALRLAIAAITKAEVAGKSPVTLTDEQIVDVLRSEGKKRAEAADLYEQGQRTELAERERTQAAVLERYLPAEMDDAQLQAIVAEEVEAALGIRRGRRQGDGPGDEGGARAGRRRGQRRSRRGRGEDRPRPGLTVDTTNLARPEAVLLDVGGVFLLPEHQRIRDAFARAGIAAVDDTVDLDVAHFTGAARFTTNLDVEADWAGAWHGYLDAYIDACAVPDLDREEVHRHIDSEFADAALWLRIIPGCREGIRALADTGVRLGIISNADGLIAERLRTFELVQVGPGIGVEVECIIDSGAVGVMKPDPRIFTIALDAMDLAPEHCWYVGDMPGIDVVGARAAGLYPVLADPCGLHHDADYDRMDSLSDLADRITAL